MNKLHITTRGLCAWRSRLANPEKQWKRKYSAFECAVSWELATRRDSGLPPQIELALKPHFNEPTLQLAIAEHKVPLPGGRAASQNDVWAIVSSSQGTLSLAVEAKANEPFGDENLDKWLDGTGSEASKRNRKERGDYLFKHLPVPRTNEGYADIRYQLLHRCASSVIEAKRFGLRNAVFIVQQFESKSNHWKEFDKFCHAIGMSAVQDSLSSTTYNGIQLSVGWVNCDLASDSEIASVSAEN